MVNDLSSGWCLFALMKGFVEAVAGARAVVLSEGMAMVISLIWFSQATTFESGQAPS